MPKYGAYEVVREVYRGPVGTILTARRPAARQLHVLKVYCPPVDLWDRATAERETEGFLRNAQAQKELSVAGAAHWRPVKETDVADGGEAYYAGTYCRWSAHSATAGHLRPGAAGLYRIMRGAL